MYTDLFKSEPQISQLQALENVSFSSKLAKTSQLNSFFQARPQLQTQLLITEDDTGSSIIPAVFYVFAAAIQSLADDNSKND